MHDIRGQAAVDYLAVVLVVVLVAGALAGVLAGTGLGEHVIAALRRALCVVTGGPCAPDEAARPCVRLAREHVDDEQLDASIVHLGGRDTELREHRSDGTVAVSLVHDRSAGLVAGAGARLAIRWGSFSRAVGSELRIAALAERTSGRTWIVPDDSAADRLIARVDLSDRALPTGHVRGPAPPAQTFSDLGGRVSLDLGAASGQGVHLDGGHAYGERRDRTTGERTIYVRNRLAGSGSVAVGMAGGAATGGLEERYGITLDRAGRPTDLEVLSSFDVAGAVGLPPRLAQIAGWLRIPSQGAAHLETEQHLDLTDAANGAIARAFLNGFGRDALGVSLLATALRRRLDHDGTTRVRTYDERDSGEGIGGHVGAWLLAVGGQASSEDTATRLRSAVIREPGGPWRADSACLA